MRADVGACARRGTRAGAGVAGVEALDNPQRVGEHGGRLRERVPSSPDANRDESGEDQTCSNERAHILHHSQ
jgi:hypothetical protein